MRAHVVFTVAVVVALAVFAVFRWGRGISGPMPGSDARPASVGRHPDEPRLTPATPWDSSRDRVSAPVLSTVDSAPEVAGLSSVDEALALDVEAVARRPALATDLVRLAVDLRHAGSRGEALVVLDHALRLVTQALGDESVALISLYSERGFEAAAAGDFALARQDGLRAFELAEACYGPNGSITFERLRVLTELHRRLGDDGAADGTLLELARRQEGAVREAVDPETITALETNLARDLEVLGDDVRAEAGHLAALREVSRDPDATPLEVTASLRELERFYAERGRLEESRDLLLRIVELRSQDAQASASELGRALVDLGSRQLELSERGAARQNLERAADLYDGLPVDTRGDRGIRLMGLRQVAMALNDFPGAAGYYLEALENDADTRTPEAVVEQLVAESELWLSDGQPERSAESAALAFAVAEIHLGPGHPLTAELAAPLPIF